MTLIRTLCFVAIALPVACLAQVEKTSFDHQPISVVLSKLFTGQASFVLMPGVEGTVTASFETTDHEIVLKSVLKAVNATFRVEDGVYFIVPAGNEVPGNYLFDGVPVRTALRALFEDSASSYSISPDVTGNVTGRFSGVSTPKILTELTVQCHARFVFDDGIFKIVPDSQGGVVGQIVPSATPASNDGLVDDANKVKRSPSPVGTKATTGKTTAVKKPKGKARSEK